MEPIPSTSRDEPMFKKCRIEDCIQLDSDSDTDIEDEESDAPIEEVTVQLGADEIAAVLEQLPFQKVVTFGRLNKEWSQVSPRVTIREVRLGSDLGLETMSGKSKDAISRIRLLEEFKGVRRINVEKIQSYTRIKPVFRELGSFCSRVEEIVGSPENIDISMNGYSIGAGLNQSLYAYVNAVDESGNENNIKVIRLQTRQFDPKKPYDEDEDIDELVKRCPRADQLVLALTRMEVSKQRFLKAWSLYGARIKMIHLYRGDQSVFDSFTNLRNLTEFKTEIRDLKIETISALVDNCKFLKSLSISCSADFLPVVRRFRDMKKICLKIKSRPHGNIIESGLITLFSDEEFARSLTSVQVVNHTQTCLNNLPQSVVNAIASTCLKLRHVTLVTTMKKLVPLDQLSTLESITVMHNTYSKDAIQNIESVLTSNPRMKCYTIVRTFQGHRENVNLMEAMTAFISSHQLVKFRIFLTRQVDPFEENLYRKMMSKVDNLSVQYKRII